MRHPAGQLFLNYYTEEAMKISTDLFTSVEGRFFDNWIDRSVSVLSVNPTTDEITFSEEHNFSNNSYVNFVATPGNYPTGLTGGTRYFVIHINSTTIKLSGSFSGSAINIGSAGSGAMSVKRSNGHESGAGGTNSLINSPNYIVESILRDEVFKENGITINTVLNNYDEFTVNGLKQYLDGYYNGSILIDRTLGRKVNVLNYYGEEQKFITDSDIFTTHASGNYLELYNINGNKKIDCSTFDFCGNTYDGKRKDWIFNASLYKKSQAHEILSTLLFESHSMLSMSNGKYKIIPIGETELLSTWTNPLKIDGREGISSQLTPIENVYNNFTINWAYNIASNEYQRTMQINRNSAPGFQSSNNLVGDIERNLCRHSFSKYKFERPYQYGCAFIYDDITAERLIQLLVRWFSKRRLVVNWEADFKNYIKYEIGDLVYLDYDMYIPQSMRGTSKFMIVGRQIYATNVPRILFTLIETT